MTQCVKITELILSRPINAPYLIKQKIKDTVFNYQIKKKN